MLWVGTVWWFYPVFIQSVLQPLLRIEFIIFVAWPMLAVCVILFMFREEDRLLQVDKKFA